MADVAHTLLEASNLMEPSRKAGVVNIYANESKIAKVAPVIDTGGKQSYNWTQEDDLAYTTGGSRNVGADFDATQGTTAPFESPVKIYGGKIKVDEFIIDHSPASIKNQEMSQIRSFARRFDVDIFEGAGGTALRGVKDWVANQTQYSGQVMNASDTTNAAPTMDMMDELVEKVDRTDMTVLYMNEYPWRILKGVARGLASTSQRINYGPTEFGKWVPMYDGIPIVVMRDGSGANMLSVTEAAVDETNSTSIYLVAWGMESASLFSSNGTIAPNGVPVPKLTKENDGTNFKYERLTWYVGFVPHKPRSIAQLRYVKPAAS